ncbi:MAG: alpha/beta hydrolase [Bacteroidales bacterium]|nr:alpha/beta hydrolase [Bacteroidales bacterium]
MKSRTIILSVLLLAMVLPANGNPVKEYMTGTYVLKFVNQLPKHAANKIMIISTRQFKPEKGYELKKGLDPQYQRFYFIAGTLGDTAYVEPMTGLDETNKRLPADRDFLVYVDGHGKTFQQVLERGFHVSERFAVNMVVFDWPTDNMALKKTAYAASEVAPNFVKAMRELGNFRHEQYPSSSVSAMFHSMGNQVLRNVAKTSLISYMPKELFSNLILNAAAVNQHHHRKWLEKLNIQERIYVTINDDDFTLHGAMILRAAKQLGLGYRGNTAINANYVNFSDVATREHNLFLGKSATEKNNPYIYLFFEQAFHGREVNFSESTGFQIFRPSESDLFSSR